MKVVHYIQKLEKEFPGAAAALAALLIVKVYPGNVKNILTDFYKELKNEFTTKEAERTKMIERKNEIIAEAKKLFPDAENDIEALDKYTNHLFGKVFSVNSTAEVDELDKQFTEAKSLYMEMRIPLIRDIEASVTGQLKANGFMTV